MKRLVSALAALSLLLVAVAWSGASASTDAGYGFDRFLKRYEKANTAFVNGDPRSHVLYTGQNERQEQVLRSTMIFRFERGSWKIVHRHADTMVDLELPGAD